MFQRLKDGGITLTYEDYNVEAFGGADYEVIYTLTKEESDKLNDLLIKEYKEKEGKDNLDLKILIIYKFGERLEKISFASYCDSHNIKYELQTFVH